ncbi:MAG: nucleotidyltransferase family protein [Thermodesulfovibrionales bacterium]|nr:nucleotidyltransferase family protein [Thermodesulfovibrionales bacterium]
MELNKLIITPDKTVKAALKQIDKGGEGILFVADKEMRLIGVLTDGDIRRHILKNGNLNDTIEGCFNKNPVYLKEGYDPGAAKKLLVKHQIDIIPVTDGGGGLTGFITWPQVFGGGMKEKEKIDLPVVIMAGGRGTRLDPFTKILPKPLIPIGEKPIVELIMDKFNEYGVSDFYLTVNYKAEMIKSYFDNVETGYKIRYIREKDFLGTAGSLRLLPGGVGGTFIVSNCDIIVEADYADLVKFHKKGRHSLTIVGSIQHYKIPYGIIEYKEGGGLKAINEKPEYDMLINTGLYVLEKEALEHISKGKAFHMTDLISALLKKKKKIGVYPVSEKSYVDIGQWEEYKKNIDRLITE